MILSHTIGKRVKLILQGESIRHEGIIIENNKVTHNPEKPSLHHSGIRTPEYGKMYMEKITKILNTVSKLRKMRLNAQKRACITRKIK